MWRASLSQLIASNLVSQPLNNDEGSFFGKVPSLIPHRLQVTRGSHLYTVPVQVNDTQSIQEPDSQFLHELVPSPLGLKATLGVGVVPTSHLACPTQSRVITVAGVREEDNKNAGVGTEGKRSDHAQASCSVVRYIFSVTACVSTHRACAFSLNNSPWKAHLANVAMNVCFCGCVCVWCVTRLCVKSYGCVLAPPSLPHPPPQQGKAEGLHLVGLIFGSFRQAFWEA